MTATLTRGSLRCPPRFGTPRNFDLPTLGGEIGDIAARLGTPFMPWQQWQVDVSYEYDPDTGLFVYDEDDTLVPRQSGKTTKVRARAVHRLTRMARRLGPQRSAYYAQTRLAARKKLERDFAAALRASSSFREVPHNRIRPTGPAEWRLSLNNGSESIEFGGGSYWQIDAPSRTGGHGDTLDEADIDEAFAHQDDTVEGSVRPAQATRTNAKLHVSSTAGDAKSLYLWRKVVAGRAACESGNHGRTAYFEWSAPDDADPGDPETWRACSPALGHTITEEFLASEWQRALRKGDEGINTFRRAYLNQWPEVPVLDAHTLKGWQVVTRDAWRDRLDPDAVPAGALSWAFDVSPDGRSAAIACSNGTYVEVVDHRAGMSWVPARLRVLHRDHSFAEVAFDATGPAGSLIPSLDEFEVPYRKVTLQEHAQACGGLLDAIEGPEPTLVHRGQPILDAAVEAAARRHVTDVWLWTRSKSSGDISPLVAVTLARWAASGADVVPGFYE